MNVKKAGSILDTSEKISYRLSNSLPNVTVERLGLFLRIRQFRVQISAQRPAFASYLLREFIQFLPICVTMY